MKHFVAIMDSGSIVISEGNTVSEALGTPIGINYWLEAKHKLVCDQINIGTNKHDTTATFAIDTVTKPYSFILADVMPLSSNYQSIVGKRFESKMDIAQAIKDINNK